MKENKLISTTFLFLIQITVFAQSKTEEFKAFKAKYSSKEFDYVEEINKVKPKEIPPETYEPNGFLNFLRNLAEFISGFPWSFVFYTFIILFLAFIAYRIYKNGGLFKPNAKKIYNESDFDYIEENLAEVNLNSLITKAENEGKYPLAIRYLHYQNLQNLYNRDLIQWDPKKTNQQFINQIKDEKIRILFSTNTQVFNQIWFGEFIINEEKYQEYKAMFNQLNLTIK
ncbi:hypothetical protein [Algoriella sp.]|uniref:hypothetical protein n=1 Tax=Algoriella sp. TaxID=1872434 RepID=UPI002FC86EE6